MVGDVNQQFILNSKLTDPVSCMGMDLTKSLINTIYRLTQNLHSLIAVTIPSIVVIQNDPTPRPAWRKQLHILRQK
jgi:hypothetical protein